MDGIRIFSSLRFEIGRKLEGTGSRLADVIGRCFAIVKQTRHSSAFPPFLVTDLSRIFKIFFSIDRKRLIRLLRNKIRGKVSSRIGGLRKADGIYFPPAIFRGTDVNEGKIGAESGEIPD